MKLTGIMISVEFKEESYWLQSLGLSYALPITAGQRQKYCKKNLCYSLKICGLLGVFIC